MKNKNIPSLDKPGIKKYYEGERTEEVRDIIERMPTSFGLWISAILVGIFLTLLFFGFVIRYPDVIKGQVSINTSISPIKLVATTSGKLKLNNISSQSAVNEGTIVGYIENATSYDTLQMIKRILEEYGPANALNTSILSVLPARVTLGGLTPKYYNFLSSLQQMENFNNDRLYDKQIISLQDLHIHQVNEINNSSERIGINNNVLAYSSKFLKRDSILYAGKVAAEAELDKTKMNYLTSESALVNAKSSLIEAKKQAQQTMSKIAEVSVQRSEKRKELEISLIAAYTDLIDNIHLWEQQYLFMAPFKGRVQFLRFWTDDQFVQSGEAIFTVVPETDEPYGQVLLPAAGAGKVKIGQEVIVKLDDFPYNEYGSITGMVDNISLTSNTEKTPQGNIEIYLVTVRFPKGLTTNYRKQVSFKHESKGSAEIITNDRRLMERLFDNLKYVLNK